ncbi:multidrug transporter [Enterococcus cecorum]|uniref:multidrug transporter n=1 Tax=Enterococcus cecorum TaxID=44008 RepID=UPI000B201A59|nr:multidrug transporter [Enterococcus cecorum]MCJ0543659.1 multidrug transporter [Enterococcus cecorum]MCJ0548030.1 multidrug transporter [Enterococcus cecorum]MCJ0564266.1 multidrug transporter [Enterococcus cecorum]MCJ0567309.1 multidrug transporter [Enterococcus cecorum]MCJ0588131.1 multidrug transporter [Enterococcus cecorum]
MPRVGNEHDWKLLKKRLPGWQEAFMASRIEEYVKLLSNESKLASDRFWQLDKMTKEDRKKTGVIAEMSCSDKDLILLNLLREGAITESDLEGFSEELIEAVRYFYKKLNGRKK